MDRARDIPVAFTFKKASCVVAGTFNMYVIQPPWFTKIGIFPKGIEVAIGTHLDEPGFRYAPTKNPFRWFVTPHRVEVETRDPEGDCGAPMASVLEALPWTPLVALGNNVIYTAPLADLDGLREEFRRSPQAPEGYAMKQRSMHFGLSREGAVMNLQLSITPEELELSVNTHTELRKKESEDAQAAARRFIQDRRDAETLIQQLFGVSVEYGNRNTEQA
jgi:hypothetical protein